jgi:hypothetical protein
MRERRARAILPGMEPDPLEQQMDLLFGAGDLRLAYGITVPALVAIFCIILFAVSAEWWLLVPTLLAVIVCTVVVAIGVSKMIDEEEDNEPLI